MATKTLAQDLGIGGQYLQYRELLQVGDHKLQITIHRDSYDMQSYARIERWDGNQWQTVDTLHYSLLAVCKTNAVNGHKAVNPYDTVHHTAAVFQQDRNTLLNRAKLVLGISKA